MSRFRPWIPAASPGPSKLPPPDTADERVHRAARRGTRLMDQRALFPIAMALPSVLLLSAVLFGMLTSWWALLAVPIWGWAVWRGSRSGYGWRHTFKRRQNLRERLPKR
ncbi:MAG: hypothetical protein H6835_10870 [Planctomycetes bacterium]|nr:hypothetical protein [Planctomycetota bacterium]